MDKIPFIAVNEAPIDLWYEGPTFLMADKPPGLAVHPDNQQGTDSVVNRLLHNNRWLAEMETSHRPGVIHTLAHPDRGLVLIAKSDEMAEVLRNQYAAGDIMFSFRVLAPSSTVPHSHDQVTIFDHQSYQDKGVWDIDSSIGDTTQLRKEWLHSDAEDIYFVLYRLTVRTPQKTVTAALGDRIWLPSLELYTVPPCSVCNGTKAFLSYNGFAYVDYSLTEEANVAVMRQLRGDDRGIPVIRLNGQTSVGFDRHRLKKALGLF